MQHEMPVAAFEDLRRDVDELLRSARAEAAVEFSSAYPPQRPWLPHLTSRILQWARWGGGR